MPHSSGGGSHGGGSHGGSRSSSGSSKPSGVMNRPYPGASRYVYYRHHKPVFIYSNRNPEHSFRDGLLQILLITIVLIPIAIFCVSSDRHNPKKMKTDYDTQIVIQDDANVLTKNEELLKSLNAFFDTTGITPAVFTVKDEVWRKSYTTLERFAYDKYLDLFEDEKHWLIVYSPGAENDTGFDDWHWEGMQGDDTDPILSEHETNIFNDALQKALLQREKYEISEAIANAFDTLTPVVMNSYLTSYAFATILTFVVAYLLMFFFYFHPIRDSYYSKAVACPNNLVDQETCGYCDGVYVVGLHNNCPHCGAPITPKS